MSVAIEFNHISKQYRLGLVSTRTLSHDLNRWWTMNVLRKEDPYLKIGETNDRSTKGNSEYVWALRDIDFKIEQGDVVGIIGKNGAGKSTLLKLLSRVTAPTTGTIRAKGRIASLLEVGTGFHPEMTGRENIFMNGAIMGMTKQEIRSKLDEIVDFSGCERYLDTPVKRYSSGMMVRLGFAVAAHLDPEILVVDEVLAVGDAEFQKKAIGKMQDVSRGEGRTVLFVSHNMTAVKNLCKSGVLLENGQLKMLGRIDDVIKVYQTNINVLADNALESRTDRAGNGKVRLIDVSIQNFSGEKLDSVMVGDSFNIILTLRNYNWTKNDKIQEIAVAINDEYGQRNIVMNNIFVSSELQVNSSVTYVSVKVYNCPLSSGTYTLAFFMNDVLGNVVDWVDHIGKIEIEPGDFYGTGKIPRKGLGKFLVKYDMQNIV